jgi:hypothetical protein
MSCQIEQLKLTTFPDARVAEIPWLAPAITRHSPTPPACPSVLQDTAPTRVIQCPHCLRYMLACALPAHTPRCPHQPENYIEQMVGTGMTARGLPKRAAASAIRGDVSASPCDPPMAKRRFVRGASVGKRNYLQKGSPAPRVSKSTAAGRRGAPWAAFALDALAPASGELSVVSVLPVPNCL